MFGRKTGFTKPNTNANPFQDTASYVHLHSLLDSDLYTYTDLYQFTDPNQYSDPNAYHHSNS
jgi:hypothetical protein